MAADPRVNVGVGCVLTRYNDLGESEVLLLRRGKNATHGANTWALIGGWIDHGETPEEAAVRELAEEAGIIVDVLDLCAEDAVANTYRTMHIVCVAVVVDQFDDSEMKNMEPEKADLLLWVRLDDLPNLELFPPTKSIAEKWGWL